MTDDAVTRNLQGMDELDFNGWNRADWHGSFARCHTEDVLVEVKGQPATRGIQDHIEAMKALVESTGGTPIQVASNPISFDSGEWTCVVGEFEGSDRMVTIAKWRGGAVAEEYIWIWAPARKGGVSEPRWPPRRGRSQPAPAAQLGELLLEL